MNLRRKIIIRTTILFVSMAGLLFLFAWLTMANINQERSIEDWVVSVLIAVLVLSIYAAITQLILDRNVLGPLSSMLNVVKKVDEDHLVTLSGLMKNHNPLDRLGEVYNELLDEVQLLTGKYKALQENLHTALEISKTISFSISDENLIMDILACLVNQTNIYYAGIYLVDINNEYAELRAGSGDIGNKMLVEGKKYRIDGDSLISWVIVNGEPKLAFDLGVDAVKFEYSHLPRTRSELLLPLYHENKVIGALTLHSMLARAFEEDDINVFMQIAFCLGKTLEFIKYSYQMQIKLDEVQAINRLYTTEAWDKFARDHDIGNGSNNGYTPKGNNSIRLPMNVRGEDIGEIIIGLNQNELPEEDLVFIESITAEAALALENARLLEEAQYRNTEEKFLSDFARKVRSAYSIEAVLRTTINELGHQLDVKEGFIQLQVDDDN
jgi:GAF domain-containing protein